MSDYAELIKELRYCKDDAYCSICSRYEQGRCFETLHNDAAAAIEDLQKDLTTLQKCYEIADTTVDEVLKQLPKRGEWVGVSPAVDTVQCSVCGGQLFSAELETPYCPYCGAKMEVQDG